VRHMDVEAALAVPGVAGLQPRLAHCLAAVAAPTRTDTTPRRMPRESPSIASAMAETGRLTMPGIRVGLRDQLSSAWSTVGWQAMRESTQRVVGLAPVFAATRVGPGTSRIRP
jgi:hypothetical protein